MNRLILTSGLVAGAALAAAIAAPASAQRWNDYGWRTIAYKTVDGRDTDRITVRGTHRQRAVRLCSMNAPIHLRDFDIKFDNGGHQDVNTRARLGAGQCTRAIDLRGELLSDTAAWKIPKKLVVMAQLPVTARGKTDAAALRTAVF